MQFFLLLSELLPWHEYIQDYEDARGHEEAFKLIFDTAEKDVGCRISWVHIVSFKHSIGRIKAVLVDEHAGQIKGLANYFVADPEYMEHDADWHILRIVKICRVHYKRSIDKLKIKGVDKGISLLRSTND
jgi:hypothetical protein